MRASAAFLLAAVLAAGCASRSGDRLPADSGPPPGGYTYPGPIYPQAAPAAASAPAPLASPQAPPPADPEVPVARPEPTPAIDPPGPEPVPAPPPEATTPAPAGPSLAPSPPPPEVVAAPAPPSTEATAPTPLDPGTGAVVPVAAEVRTLSAPPGPAPIPAASKVPIGRPVARVGDEIITLPELTRAVKARLGELPPEASPSRRQVIALARSVLKAMVVRSLVIQEAEGALGGPAKVEAATARIEGRWAERGLPDLLRREGAATDADLRARLAGRFTSPEAARDEFVVRTLAGELMARDGWTRDLDGYLDALRKRRPIESIMTPSEMASEGRRAALAEGSAIRR